MQLLGNLKIHFLALVLTVVAEFIGIKKLGPVVLLPLLYTLILGLLISIPKFKILTIKQMEKSADYIGIAVMILMVKSRFRYWSKSWYSYKCWLGIVIARAWSFLWYYCIRFTCSFACRYASRSSRSMLLCRP